MTERPGPVSDDEGRDHDQGGEPWVVVVERTGGVAGMRATRDVNLDSLPTEEAEAWHRLLGSPLLRELGAAPTHPDRYVYRVACPPVGLDVTAAEQQLPSHVRELFERTLRRV